MINGARSGHARHVRTGCTALLEADIQWARVLVLAVRRWIRATLYTQVGGTLNLTYHRFGNCGENKAGVIEIR